MNKTVRAHVFLFVSQVIYAISFVIAKILTADHIPPFALVMLRVLFAAPMFWLTAAVFVREKTERKDIPKFILLAIFGVIVNQTFFIKGLSLTSPISAAIMMITSPILVIIVASILIKEKITWIRMLGIVLGFAGAATLMISSGMGGGGREDNLFGDLMIFINAASWGFYLVLVKPLMKKYHTVTILRWIFTFGLFAVVPIGFDQFSSVQWSSFSNEIWFYTFFVAFGTTYLAYILNVYALKDLSPSVVSAYIYFQPVLTALIAISTGHDELDAMKIISALMIFAGVFIVSRQPSKSETIADKEMTEAPMS